MKLVDSPIFAVTVWLVLLGGARIVYGVDFEADIAPILAGRCLECHDADQKAGGLNLSSQAGMRLGGESGPAIAAESLADSFLLRRVTAGEMPPESRGQQQTLTREELERLRAWITRGAEWPEHRVLSRDELTSHLRAGRDWWSFQPIDRPSLSQKEGAAIDVLIRARLAENGLSMAPRADHRKLIRRAYFDLIGLPPTPAQLARAMNDDRPDAWARLIDELLASTHYGERWARHWLDVVRFAETCGYERDQLKPGIWKYRDWVIEAFNTDMPFDQFVTDQLAGDEVADRDLDSVTATGMLRAGTWNDEPNDPADYVYERLEDMVHVTCSAFLALTVKCARCHDHKFDPIPQTDYYRVASFFWAGYIGQANLGGPSTEELGFDVFGWTDRDRQAPPLHRLQNGDRHRPTEVVEPGFLSAVPWLDRPLAPPHSKSESTTRRLQFANWITDLENPLTARVIVNRLWLHHFGKAIVRTPNNFGFKGAQPTHPRLLDWLAAELIEPSVDVGQGMQAWTLKRIHKLIMLSDAYCQSCVHPQQTELVRVDSQNERIWRFNRRRLEAEALRDAMLAVSGELNQKRGGPSFYPRMSHEALEGLSRKSDAWAESPADERRRRSIYMMTKRSRILPLMKAFDFCDTTRPSAQRDVTTQPTQALVLLNNHFVHQRSLALAKRVLDSQRDIEAGIHMIWQLALSRNPDAEELQWARQHVTTDSRQSRQAHKADPTSLDTRGRPTPKQFAWASLCHALLNTNEFIYID